MTRLGGKSYGGFRVVPGTQFILNQNLIHSSDPDGLALVDAIRQRAGLKGTTVACREGDCGACTVIVGEWDGNEVVYRAITSCISPLVNAHGKHIVTIEGLSENPHTLSPMQNALIEHAATQCGFCTPGFIVSLAGYLLKSRSRGLASDAAKGAMDGNICRCTGYKAIERATESFISSLQRDLGGEEPNVERLVALGVLPAYFLEIPARLQSLHATPAFSQAGTARPAEGTPARASIGGGTDLWVQRPDELRHAGLRPLLAATSPASAQACQPHRSIRVEGSQLVIGAAASIEDLKQSALLERYIPRLGSLLQMFASTQIRQQASVAGNIVNASPIGDISNFFLALEADLVLALNGKQRIVALSKFYTGYKQKDLRPDEVVVELRLTQPTANSYINLEKVSRRKYLDIAAVTSSMHVQYDGQLVQHAVFSAGGVAAFPLTLRAMSAALIGKPLTPEVIQASVALAQAEISPISDGRGSAAYKRLLLRQLLYAHFFTCFPQNLTPEALAL